MKTFASDIYSAYLFADFGLDRELNHHQMKQSLFLVATAEIVYLHIQQLTSNITIHFVSYLWTTDAFHPSVHSPFGPVLVSYTKPQ